MIALPYRILAAALLAIGLAGGGFIAGLHHERKAWQDADALRASQDTAKLLKDTQDARAREQALRAQLDAAKMQRLKEQSDHEKNLAAVRAAARAGTERLHCPIAALPVSPTPDHSAPAARSEPEARPSDLVPEASDALFGIAGSIVEIVRQRNALIEDYETARATCNAN